MNEQESAVAAFLAASIAAASPSVAATVTLPVVRISIIETVARRDTLLVAAPEVATTLAARFDVPAGATSGIMEPREVSDMPRPLLAALQVALWALRAGVAVGAAATIWASLEQQPGVYALLVATVALFIAQGLPLRGLGERRKL